MLLHHQYAKFMSMKISGNILKLKSQLGTDGKVEYQLPLGDELVSMNELVGQKISMKFDGQINCIATGEKINKTYNQGYSYKAFISLARCDMCIMKPELCHYDKGTCREPKWGEEHCLQPHIVYLSLTSGAKVGITRKKQVPTRWVDQGATQALEIAEVKDRKTSGELEVYLKNYVSDKTNWRHMLQNKSEDIDLEYLRDEMLGHLELTDFEYIEKETDITHIDYPVLEYPEKVKSIGFDKKPLIEGQLQGIKGQYLILDSGVINMRKHQGYFIEFSV